ncbi:MAG: DNA repair protein [Bdellovibrio sp.]|nr:DNA repair protein [Bdellovibrio sp.]
MAGDARGSKWRIWDLHVHTPESHETHYGGEKEQAWTKFLADLEALPQQFKVIGINDYLFIDGYKRLLAEKEKGRLKNIDLFLPVIELRLRQFTGHAHLSKINYHILFSDSVKPNEIEDYFIKHLKIEYTNQLGQKWERYLTRENLVEFGKVIKADAPQEKQKDYGADFLTGIKHADFELGAIDDLLKSQPFNSKFLTAIGKVEWASHQWVNGVAAKKQIINNVNIVFTASETSEGCQKSIESLKAQQVNSKLFHCSDSHYPRESAQFQRIGSCFSWIKADTSFDGLKYAIEEYSDRVFIGAIPPKLESIQLNPTKYIDSISLKKRDGSTLEEAWFGGSIKFNADLVAIIGNKGSGKSALADIIGLLGNSCREEAFSFLVKDRFRDPKTKKASHFEATLQWRSGLEVEKTLDDPCDSSRLESVKYIPQNFLETICNEVDDGGETEFDREIKGVIFSHIEESDRLRQSSLDDLLKFRTEETNSRISKLKIDLNRANVKIAELERKASRKELDRVLELHEKKRRELEAHDKIKPQQIEEPKKDSAAAKALHQVNAEITEKRKVFDALSAEVKAIQAGKNTEVLRLAKLQKIITKVDNFRIELADFEQELQDDLNDFGLRIDQILEIKLDKQTLETLEKQVQKKIAEYNLSIDVVSKDSCAQKLKVVQAELEQLQQKLDEPGKRYQQYLQILDSWQKKRDLIEGSETVPESLKYYAGLVSASKDYPEQVDKLKKTRKAVVERIFDEIHQLSEIFKGYYGAVQRYVSKHDLAKDKFEFRFSVEKHIGDFSERFFDWIDRGTGSGAFSGVDSSRKFIRQILSESTFETKDGLISFLKRILAGFNDGEKGLSPLETIERRLKKGKRVDEFYDFLFSLDYLRPKYVLKWGDKELNQLSPGQKGLLLLSFYLIVDKNDVPLVIDQPEENLDNQTVYDMLVPFIKEAKNRRQIFIVTHNPNLAVVCDAEQIVWSDLDVKNNFKINYTAGAIENPTINKKLVDILEGTYPAFNKRGKKYFESRL